MWPIEGKIIYRLLKRFGLKDYGLPMEASMSDVIHPVSDADSLLRDVKVATVTKDISPATGYTTFYTVPAKKRWRILRYRKEGTVGVSMLNIFDGDAVRMRFADSGTASAYENLGHEYMLEPGWQIQMFNTNNVADTDIDVDLWYTEEDAF